MFVTILLQLSLGDHPNRSTEDSESHRACDLLCGWRAPEQEERGMKAHILLVEDNALVLGATGAVLTDVVA